ncbi:MAG: alpha/beta fold hydrolase [Symbiobacteriia bacterium]
MNPKSFAEHDGTAIHYLDWGGEGAPVLLIHGMRGRAELWAKVAAELTREFRVVAMDVRGHGWSGRPRDGAYDRFTLAGDAVAVLDAAGVQQASVIGHSLGGWIGVTMAAQFAPRVKRLVIEDINLDGNSDAEADWAKLAASARRSFATREEGLDWLRAGGANPDWAGASLEQQPNGSWAWAFDYDALVCVAAGTVDPYWDLAARVSQPVLLLWARKGWIHTAESAQRMAAAFTGVRGVVPFDTNHWIHGLDPEGYLRTVRPFLQGKLD